MFCGRRLPTLCDNESMNLITGAALMAVEVRECKVKCSRPPGTWNWKDL